MTNHLTDIRSVSMLYGRDEHLSELHEAFRWVALGSTELTLVAGNSGVGKTALVLDLFKPIVMSQCRFAWGKADSQHVRKPYEPIIQCFQYVIKQLLTEPEDRLRKWSEVLKRAVGDNGAVIAQIIPEASLLLGSPSRSEILPPVEAQHRFEMVFRRFVRAFTSAGEPLVLFVDDLQLADRATLQLLHALLADPEVQHLHVIGAYRELEWEQNLDILNEWLDRLDSNFSVRNIKVEALDFCHVLDLAANMLDCRPNQVYELAQTLYVKSVGNPFYLKQLLLAAQDESMVGRDDSGDEIRWDEEKIHGFPGIEGQLDYLTARIKRLPVKSREAMVQGSCLGGIFSFELLNSISRSVREELRGHLEFVVEAGLLTKVGELQYRFAHDRIHQAAYSLAHADERMQVRLMAGAHLLKLTDESKLDEMAFEIADHWNEAESLLGQEEKVILARMNVRAGRQAMLTSAYDAALSYFTRALLLMPSLWWRDEKEYAFQVILQTAECEYLCGNYERAEERLDEALRRADNWLQRAWAIKIRIDQYSNTGQYAQAIECGLATLREAGIHIPKRPDAELVSREMRMTQRLLDFNMEELLSLHECNEPKVAVMMEIATSLVGPMLFSNREAFAVMTSKFVRLLYSHGMTAVAPAVCAAFGMTLSTVARDYMKGYRLGEIAVELADRLGAASIRSKVYTMFYCVISPWLGYKPADEHKLSEAARLGMESGDYVYASYAIGGLINMSYAVHSTYRMHEVMRQSLQVLEITKEELVYKNIIIYMHLSELLRATSQSDQLQLVAGRTSESELIADIAKDESRAVTFYQLYTYKTQISYLFGRYEEAEQYAVMADPYEYHSVQSPHLPIHHQYEALALAALLRGGSRGESDHRRRKLKLRCRQFRKWAGVSPHFFQAKYKLIYAEMQREQGSEVAAIDAYDQAIRLAAESGDYQTLAIASECAAAHHGSKGRERIARAYMQEAYEAYGKWGVEAKLEALRKQFPNWFASKQETDAEAMGVPDKRETGNRDTDERSLIGILKQSMALSPSMNYIHIVDRLAALIMQVSQARYGCLIAARADEPEVELAMGHGGHVKWLGERLNESSAVPCAMIYYVTRTGEAVQEEQSVLNELFRNEPYFANRVEWSVYCLPIYAQGRLAGVLYLELGAGVVMTDEAATDALCLLAAQTLFVLRLEETFGPGAEANGDEMLDSGERGARESERRQLDALTERELEVLHLMSTGLTNKEIAVQLGIAAGTVKVHTHNIFSKLNVHRRTGAIAEATKMKLL